MSDINLRQFYAGTDLQPDKLVVLFKFMEGQIAGEIVCYLFKPPPNPYARILNVWDTCRHTLTDPSVRKATVAVVSALQKPEMRGKVVCMEVYGDPFSDNDMSHVILPEDTDAATLIKETYNDD